MSDDHETTLWDFDADAVPTTQRTITVVHREDDHDTYGGRGRDSVSMFDVDPPTSGWLGNPYRLYDHSRAESITRFERAFIERLGEDAEFAEAVVGLAGERVACWCRHADESEPACHLDVVRAALLDGRVYRAARDHGVELEDWQEAMA